MLRDKFFFILLLLFLPTQLAKHFFIPASLVNGVRIDYLAPTFNLTDAVFLLLVLSWLGQKQKIKQITKGVFKKTNLKGIFLVGGLICLNILGANEKILSLIKLIKLLELLLIACYVYFENINLKTIINWLTIAGVYSAILGITQFILKRSVGGVFWFLGERSFTAASPGIAKAEIFGQLILRPYATFPHPNLLAGFIALLLPLLLLQFARAKEKYHRLVYQLIIALFLLILFLTLSRLGIIVGVTGFVIAAFVIGYKNKEEKKQMQRQVFLLGLFLFLFAVGLFGRFTGLLTGTEETIVQRKELVLASIQMINQNLVFGIGLNNFLPNLTFFCQYCWQQGFYQPVHNLFLLISAETGVVGLIVLIYIMLKALHNNLSKIKTSQEILLLLCWLQITALSLFDHYFYTLQQGQLLFVVLISFMMKKKRDYEENTQNLKNTAAASLVDTGNSF